MSYAVTGHGRVYGRRRRLSLRGLGTDIDSPVEGLLGKYTTTLDPIVGTTPLKVKNNVAEKLGRQGLVAQAQVRGTAVAVRFWPGSGAAVDDVQRWTALRTGLTNLATALGPTVQIGLPDGSRVVAVVAPPPAAEAPPGGETPGGTAPVVTETPAAVVEQESITSTGLRWVPWAVGGGGLLVVVIGGYFIWRGIKGKGKSVTANVRPRRRRSR